jgi:predicted enzyme related to lactoylglutathione lyase
VSNSHGRFLWYELATTDTTAAKAFYTEVVGWGAREAMPGMSYFLFTAGELPVSGLTDLPTEATGMAPHWIGYVGVDDVDAATDSTRRLGGAVHIPPTDVPRVSRFSVVADPQMATFALFKWQNPRQDPELATTGAVGWHELFAADWEKAFAFYRELFGWQKAGAEVDPMGTYQLFSAAGQMIGGMFTKPAIVPVPFWLFYFNTSDVDAAAERVRAAGGQVLEGPVEMAGGRRVVRCTDPQGAMFALTGTQSNKQIGYFEPATLRDPSAFRRFVPK